MSAPLSSLSSSMRTNCDMPSAWWCRTHSSITWASLRNMASMLTVPPLRSCGFPCIAIARSRCCNYGRRACPGDDLLVLRCIVPCKDTGRGPDQHTGQTHRTQTSTASHTAQHNREPRPSRDRRPDAATSERRRRAQGPAEPAQSHSATSSVHSTVPYLVYHYRTRYTIELYIVI